MISSRSAKALEREHERLIQYQAILRIPQSVGIAGGRPSSSVYFVGSQGDSLFYLDPHHTRQSIPYEEPARRPKSFDHDEKTDATAHASTSHSDGDVIVRKGLAKQSVQGHNTVQASPRALPSYLQLSPRSIVPVPQRRSSHDFKSNSLSSGFSAKGLAKNPKIFLRARANTRVSVAGNDAFEVAQSPSWGKAYPPDTFDTFHCDRPRRMALGSIDPSMLLGFLIRDKRDLEDLEYRVSKVGMPCSPFSQV